MSLRLPWQIYQKFLSETELKILRGLQPNALRSIYYGERKTRWIELNSCTTCNFHVGLVCRWGIVLTKTHF